MNGIAYHDPSRIPRPLLSRDHRGVRGDLLGRGRGSVGGWIMIHTGCVYTARDGTEILVIWDSSGGITSEKLAQGVVQKMQDGAGEAVPSTILLYRAGESIGFAASDRSACYLEEVRSARHDLRVGPVEIDFGEGLQSS